MAHDDRKETAANTIFIIRDDVRMTAGRLAGLLIDQPTGWAGIKEDRKIRLRRALSLMIQVRELLNEVSQE